MVGVVDQVRRSGPMPPVAPPVRPPAGADRRQAGAGTAPGGFAGVLQNEIARQAPPLQFSRHAQERLAAAGRVITPKQLEAVKAAVDKAAAKGARESLILLPDLALVVSIRNRTVITAVEDSRMREQVFTNIDSAVIVDGR